MSTTEQRLLGVQPQRLVRYVEVCEKCRAENSFRIYTTVRVNGVLYARCAHCGHRAVIMMVRRAQK